MIFSRFFDPMKYLAILFLAAVLADPVFAQQGAQQFEGFNLQGYTDNGDKAWDVKGDTAQIEGNTVHIQNVDANSYGDQQVNLKAQKGKIDKASGNVHLEKDVVITSKEGGQLTTDYLDWDKKKDLVQTDAFVTITEPKQGMTATGTGLTAQPGMKVAQMQEDVTVKVQPKQSDIQTITITSDGPMEVDQKNNKATFIKNVVAVEGDRILKADKMDVFFDAATNQIKEAVCTGNVQITQGANTTYSDRAVFNGIDKTLTLTGRPKLIMVSGEKGFMPELKEQ